MHTPNTPFKNSQLTARSGSKTYWSYVLPHSKIESLLNSVPGERLALTHPPVCHEHVCRAESLQLREFQFQESIAHGRRDICLSFKRRWEKPITRNRRAELADVWLVIKVKREMGFWTLRPRKWAWHPGKQSSDKRIPTPVLICVRKSLRLLEILDEAQGHTCRNAYASVVIRGRFTPGATQSACFPMVSGYRLGTRMFNATFHI